MERPTKTTKREKGGGGGGEFAAPREGAGAPRRENSRAWAAARRSISCQPWGGSLRQVLGGGVLVMVHLRGKNAGDSAPAGLSYAIFGPGVPVHGGWGRTGGPARRCPLPQQAA